jgi:hypothetical protein
LSEGGEEVVVCFGEVEGKGGDSHEEWEGGGEREEGAEVRGDEVLEVRAVGIEERGPVGCA